MGMLAQADELPKYLRLKRKIEDILKDSRYNFMFSRKLASDSMANFLSRILRMPTDGKPISIIDLSGVPSEVVSVVVALLSRVVFDFAIWTEKAKRHPILLVCEEAHRYVPSKDVAAGSSVRNILERIAKEGRKYGVSLGLVTQRPSDVAEGTLAQCGTIIAMRLNNTRDQEWVQATMPEGARGFLETIPALRNRECIICGEGVAVPVRLSFDTLAESRCPSSDDPSFSERWNMADDSTADLDRIIHDWRTQTTTLEKATLLKPVPGIWSQA
jgi:DNA helicase HerA-like ATPase